MNVLVADKFEKSGIDGLRAAGCEVVYEPDLADDGLTEAIRRTGAVPQDHGEADPSNEAGSHLQGRRGGVGPSGSSAPTADRQRALA